VGTKEAEDETRAHNAKYPDQNKNTKILNANLKAWLQGTVDIPDDEVGTQKPDTYSVYARYMRCLLAPNYTIFSNMKSANEFVSKLPHDPLGRYVVSLESPHDAIHLAVGGFYQKGEKGYNASLIRGVNGDMGDNETAGFDPIFFFHHCFIDYTFSVWQRLHNRTKRGDLTIIKGYPGTILKYGQPPNFAPGDKIDMSTPLYPFKDSSGKDYTSEDATDLSELGIAYGVGSLDILIPQGAELAKSGKSPFDIISSQLSDSMILAGSNPNGINPFSSITWVHNIRRNQFEGSFVIRLYARGHDGEDVEVGREPVLSRWNIDGCSNCQTHLDVDFYVPLDEGTLELLEARSPVGLTGQKAVEWVVNIQTRDDLIEQKDHGVEMVEWPKEDDL
jgi:tyrosinase